MRRLPPAVLTGLAAILLTTAVACGSSRSVEPTSRPSTSAPAATATSAPGAVSPLDFTAPGAVGGQVTGASLAGRDAVVWFWSPW